MWISLLGLEKEFDSHQWPTFDRQTWTEHSGIDCGGLQTFKYRPSTRVRQRPRLKQGAPHVPRHPNLVGGPPMLKQPALTDLQSARQEAQFMHLAILLYFRRPSPRRIAVGVARLYLRSANRSRIAAYWANWADSLLAIQSRHPNMAEEMIAALYNPR